MDTATGTMEDYRALRESHGAIDLASWGVLRLEGPDARAFLQGLGTQEFEGDAGADAVRGLTTLFLSEKGRPLALAWVLVAPDGTSASVIADEAGSAALRPHFERFHVMEEVEFSGPEGMPRVIGLAGPERNAALRLLATSPGRVAIEAEPMSLLLVPPGAASRGAAGAEITGAALSNSQAEDTTRFVDQSAFEAWRIAAGLPRTGLDFDADRIATELSLPGAISLTKGCYVGQEVVARTSNRGQVRRQRVGFRFEWGGEPLPRRAEILAAGATAGFVTSVAREPGSADGLGMGFLSTEALSGSAPVHVLQDGRIVPLRISAWPL